MFKVIEKCYHLIPRSYKLIPQTTSISKISVYYKIESPDNFIHHYNDENFEYFRYYLQPMFQLKGKPIILKVKISKNNKIKNTNSYLFKKLNLDCNF